MDCVKRKIETVISGSSVPEDPIHSKNTLEWLLKLRPDADEALQVAALGHDIERAIEKRKVRRKDFEDYDEFKAAHARNSADILMKIMRDCGMEQDVIGEIFRLVCLHEVGGDPRSELLKDADSISFFDVNLPLYFERNGWEKTRQRCLWGYRRLSSNAKHLALSFSNNHALKLNIPDLLAVAGCTDKPIQEVPASIPDFVAVGHLCCDLVDGQRILGGSASYAALTAHRLGRSVGIVTAVADDFPFLETFTGISIENVPSHSTTTFRNVYRNGVREQFISSVGAPILAAHIPDHWTSASVAYFCPIATEVTPGVLGRFPDSLIAIGAQGWLREWDESGKVRKKKWAEADSVLSCADVVIFSELDVDEPYAFAEDIARLTPVVIVTQACLGAELFVKGRKIHVPPQKIEENDATGAGDAFAAAFLVKYEQCGNAAEAARFASSAASFVCEKEGTEGVPTLQQVLARMQERP